MLEFRQPIDRSLSCLPLNTSKLILDYRLALILCLVNCAIDMSEAPFGTYYGPGVDSASNRNEYQESKKRNLGVKCGRRVGLTTLPPSLSRLSK
jgi:hypothetical protein